MFLPKKYGELSTEVKQQWHVEAVYTNICKGSLSSHTAWCPQAIRLTGFAVGDRTEICSLKYNQYRKFLGDSTLQQ